MNDEKSTFDRSCDCTTCLFGHFNNYVVDLTILKITHQSHHTSCLCGIHTSENMFSWLNKVCHAHQVSSRCAPALWEDNCIKAEPVYSPLKGQIHQCWKKPMCHNSSHSDKILVILHQIIMLQSRKLTRYKVTSEKLPNQILDQIYVQKELNSPRIHMKSKAFTNWAILLLNQHQFWLSKLYDALDFQLEISFQPSPGTCTCKSGRILHVFDYKKDNRVVIYFDQGHLSITFLFYVHLTINLHYA